MTEPSPVTGFEQAHLDRVHAEVLQSVQHSMSKPEQAELAQILNTVDRMDAQVLQNAQHAVLEKFGSYIPADTPCHHVRTEMLPAVQDGGGYVSSKNLLEIAPYHIRSGGLHQAVHEYCHCFSHPQFYRSLDNSPNEMEIVESLTEHIADKIPTYGRLSGFMSTIDSMYDQRGMANGKRMLQAAQELEAALGEATLMRAYFKGDKAAIRKLSRAAVDIYPKKVSPAAWSAALAVGGKDGSRQLAECLVAASLLSEGRLPRNAIVFSIAELPGWHLPINHFSDINTAQQEKLIEQGKKARERLGPKFDQAFYNFDKEAAKQAMKQVREDLLANWKPVLTGKPFLNNQSWE